MKFERIGVVGAGTVGRDVAYVFAVSGRPVVLVDDSPEALETARRSVRENLRWEKLFRARVALPEAEGLLQRIKFTGNLEELSQSQLVVENVTEDWSVKQSVYRRLDACCSPECVLAANTSAFPITRIADSVRRPGRVIGVHFMNPVARNSGVEVIRGPDTSPETLTGVEELLKELGKDVVVVGDSPGFVSNRVLMLAVNEAVRLVEEGVAAPPQVDRLFKVCFGHKMGPLETADLIGLDTILCTLRVLQEEIDDLRFRPSARLERMVAAGLLGRKTGEGFYKY